MLSRCAGWLVCVLLSACAGTAPETDQALTWQPAIAEASLAGSAGAPVVLKQFLIGGPGRHVAYDVAATRDGGLAVTGSSQAPGSDDLQLFVLKLDAEGRLQWARRFGGPGIEIGFSVVEQADGRIVVAGWTRSTDNGAGDFYLVGLAPDGAQAFERTYGGTGEERATGLIVTRDGGLAIIGESYSNPAGDSRYLLVKTDGQGRLQWQQSYDDGPLNERGLAILETADGYLLAGNSMDSRSGSSATVSDGLVIKTDLSGKQQWQKRFDSGEHDIIHAAVALPDHGFLLTGYTRGFGARGRADLWWARLAADGALVGEHTHGGAGFDHQIGASRVSDQRIAMLGYTDSNAIGARDGQLVILGNDGELQGDYRYGTVEDDGFSAVQALANGQLAITGISAGKILILYLEADSGASN